MTILTIQTVVEMFLTNTIKHGNVSPKVCSHNTKEEEQKVVVLRSGHVANESQVMEAEEKSILNKIDPASWCQPGCFSKASGDE